MGILALPLNFAFPCGAASHQAAPSAGAHAATASGRMRRVFWYDAEPRTEQRKVALTSPDLRIIRHVLRPVRREKLGVRRAAAYPAQLSH